MKTDLVHTSRMDKGMVRGDDDEAEVLLLITLGGRSHYEDAKSLSTRKKFAAPIHDAHDARALWPFHSSDDAQASGS